MSRPLMVGVTGGIGSGKSTVCRLFEQMGVPVYYADDRSKFLLNNDALLMSEVKKVFGVESYLEQGGLNRAFLAERVFSNEAELEKLNAIAHPAVAKDFETWLGQQDSTIVVKEAALLIENDSYKGLDCLVTVMAPVALRMERVLLRDSHRSKSQVEGIMAKQVDDAKRREVSDYLINNGGAKLLIPQVIQLHNKLRELTANKRR